MSNKDNNEVMLSNAINSLPSYMFWKDENSVFRGCNKRFADLIGLASPDDICGKTDFDLNTLEDAQRFVRTDKQVLKTNTPTLSSIEKYNDKILQVHKYPIQNEKGKATGIICMMDDFSEDEEKLKKHIKDQETKYKLLVENLSEGIWVIDKDYNTAFTNQVMANMLGYKIKDMFGRPMVDFVSKNKKELKEECAKADKEKGHQFETSLIKKDKSTIDVFIQCSSFFDKENNFKGIIASILDVTDKKVSEENLQKREETYRHLIEYTNTAFFVLNKKLNIIQTNKAFSEIVDVNIEDLIGRNPRSWVCGEDIKIFDESFSGLLLGRPINETEIMFIGENKTEIHLILNANMLNNGEQKIICLLRDVSLKKEDEGKKFIEEQKQKDRIKQKILELRGKLREDILREDIL